MDDIFQGSSLYAISHLQFSSRRQRNLELRLAFGVWKDPLAYLAGEKLGYVIKTHKQKAVQMKHELLLNTKAIQ